MSWLDEDERDEELQGFETPMTRFMDWAKGGLGLLLAAALVIPLGAGLLQWLVFDRAGDRVVDELAASDLDAALAESVLLVGGSRCTGGGAVTGTAFAAEVDGRRVLLTNAHVVADVADLGVRPLDGGPGLPVVSWQPSRSADVAVLELADPGDLPPTLPVATDGPAVGDEIRTVGFPGGMPFTTAGPVAEVDGRGALLDVRVSGGASGSPVLDARGAVVGQVYARTDGGRGVATPAGTLRAALDDLVDARSGC